MSTCTDYAVAGDPTSGSCLHPARYQTAGDEVLDYCACHYGEPHDPAECAPNPHRHVAILSVRTFPGQHGIHREVRGPFSEDDARRINVGLAHSAAGEGASLQSELLDWYYYDNTPF